MKTLPVVSRLRRYSEPVESTKIRDLLDDAACEAADLIQEAYRVLNKTLNHPLIRITGDMEIEIREILAKCEADRFNYRSRTPQT